MLILDEASQMTEPLSLLPLACARPLRMLVVGDPQVRRWSAWKCVVCVEGF